MTFHRFRHLIALLSLTALLGVAGCATNTVVPLRYEASAPKSTVACSSTITIMPFEDKRSDKLSIGTLGDGKRYYAANDPTEWISWAMFEELKARGCDVKYREKGSTAPLPKGYVITGSFDQLNVEHGATLTVKADLRVRVKLEKDGSWVMEQNYSGERERIGVTYVDAAQKVLSSTLQYILQDAATDVVKAAK